MTSVDDDLDDLENWIWGHQQVIFSMGQYVPLASEVQLNAYAYVNM